MINVPFDRSQGFNSRHTNALADAVRRCRPIAGTGIRVSTSAAGSVIECTVERNTVAAERFDCSCFCLTEKVAGGATVDAIGNPYYKDGGILRVVGDGSSIDISKMYGVICLKVSTRMDLGDGGGAIVSFGDGRDESPAHDLSRCDFRSLDYELHPLYYRRKVRVGSAEADEGMEVKPEGNGESGGEGDAGDGDGVWTGAVTVDFRNAPTVQKMELL